MCESVRGERVFWVVGWAGGLVFVGRLCGVLSISVSQRASMVISCNAYVYNDNTHCTR